MWHLVSYSLGEDVDVSIPEVVVGVVEPRHHQPALLHLALHLQHLQLKGQCHEMTLTVKGKVSRDDTYS